MISDEWRVASGEQDRLTTAPRHSRWAFTLVELLVTASLMALVAGATVSALAGGIRVWERSVEFGTHQQSVLIAFTQLEHDLRNARRFAPLLFDGAYDRVALAAVDRPSLQLNALPELGRLGYYVDERHHLLCRSFVPYPLAGHLRLTDRCHATLEDVAQVRFSYFGIDEESKATGWFSHWRAVRSPVAVKIELSLQSDRRRANPHAAMIYVADPPPENPDEAKPSPH